MIEKESVEFGNRVRQVREALRIGQADMAAVLGLHQPQVSKLEKGLLQLSGGQLKKLFAFHNVNPLFILSGQMPMFLEAGDTFPLRPQQSGLSSEQLAELLIGLKDLQNPTELHGLIHQLVHEVFRLRDTLLMQSMKRE